MVPRVLRAAAIHFFRRAGWISTRFKRRLDRLDRRISDVRDVHDHLTTLRETAPDVIRGVFDANPWPRGTQRTTWEDRARSTSDVALEHAQRITEKVEELDRRFGDRIDAHFEAVDNVWANRVEPVIERIRQLSSRSYAVQLGIDLSDELTRDIKLLADYEFDVSNPEAAIAFHRALSGRTVLQGSTEALVNWNIDQLTFADFTLADTLTDYLGTENPAVRRIATGGSDHRLRQFAVSVQGFGLSVGLDGWFQNNRVELKDESGTETQWLNRAWERGQRTRIFGVARSGKLWFGCFHRNCEWGLNPRRLLVSMEEGI